MKIMLLGIQESTDSEFILWGIDWITKMVIKIHVNDMTEFSASIGEIVEVEIGTKIKRQEVWANKIYKTEETLINPLDYYLDFKASTPFSVEKPDYLGNIVKIAEIFEINKHEISCSLIGFPHETKYIVLRDKKWIRYMNWCPETYYKDIVNSLNMIKNKYFIIDFPGGNSIGYIHAGTMVVI